jgi:hypothetical protein
MLRYGTEFQPARSSYNDEIRGRTEFPSGSNARGREQITAPIL